MTEKTTGSDPGGTYASLEAEAKDRATEVVLGYRRVEWDLVEAGDQAAVQTLLSACERHEMARHFLEDEIGELGDKLNAGLEKFYAENVGPRMRRPAVLKRLEEGSTARQSGQPNTVEESGLSPRSRPQVTVGHTVRMNTGCGHLYVTVNETEDGAPFELFNHMGKAGGCAASQNEAIGRLISYALRCGARIEPLIKQLKGISCHRPAWGENGKISSCSDAISKALEKYWAAREARLAATVGHGVPRVSEAPAVGNGNGAGKRQLLDERASFEAPGERWVEPASSGGGDQHQDVGRVQGACVDCGGTLSFEEGCVKCHSCGFTECG